MPYIGVRQVMAAMAADGKDRLEVRLDPEHSRKLDEIVNKRGTRVSAWVREAIDRSYEDLHRDERRRAVQRIAESAVEDVPDPETLARELDQAHEPRGVH
jgi:Arc/MetJ-type ribon-helix-helix transcriptional regulator